MRPPDNVTIFEDVTTTIPAAALLANDLDFDNDGLQITDVAIGFGFSGQVSLNADGDVVFTPPLNSTGISQIVYTVSDGSEGTDTATVMIDILPVNDAPTAAPDQASTSLDVPLVLRVSDLMANDSDVDLSPNQYDLLQFVGIASTTEGTVTIYDQDFAYLEFDRGFNGPVSIEYTIADDEGVEDDGTISATVSNIHESILSGSDRRDLVIGSHLGETIDTRRWRR